MKNPTAVDVFLGHPLVDATEKHFLARLRRDLALRGVCARILVNLQVGRDFRQLDFVIVTGQGAVVCELKGYADAVVARANGRWQRIVNGNLLELDGNPYRQVQDGGYALSDTMRAFVRSTGAPGPRKGKFVKDLELVVCLYPAIRAGSSIERHRWVRAVGYEELLARLQQPGPRLAWDDEHWDAFVRHLGLYRDGEDAEAARSLRASTAAVNEYSARFVSARQPDLPALVPTGVLVDGAPADRPDVAAELTDGQELLLYGASGQGKTLWASQAAVALAQAGQVPIWLAAGDYDNDFATFLSRAVAPYTTLAASELVTAARAAGRAVALIVDGLNECPEAWRALLMAGVQAIRLRASSHSALVTAQRADELPAGLSVRLVELRALDQTERRAILAAHGAERLSDELEGFETPLDLTVAASCVDNLAQPVSPAELLDVYVDQVADGEPTRAVLRSIAWRMHRELRLSLRAPDVVRTARRELELDAADIGQALDCRLLAVDQGRVRFIHERFARFLAAEALLLRCGHGQAAARALNQPRSAHIRKDAVGLESDEVRLGDMLGALEDDDVLVAAVEGRLGALVERTATAVLVDALRVASAGTTSPEVRFVPGEVGPLQDGWQMPRAMRPNDRAQLAAAGRCLRRGLFVDEVAHLIDQTDALCGAWAAGDNGRPRVEGERIFAATYAFGRPASDAVLPATAVVRACVEDRFFGHQRRDASAAARALLARTASNGLGTLYLATSLLRPMSDYGADLVPEVVAACLAAPVYHLRLEALELVKESAHGLDPAAHEAVVEAVRSVETANIFLSSAVVETLAALGDIEPRSTVDELIHELRELVRSPDDPQAWRRAMGAVSNQFEEEEIVGPYYEAIRGLGDAERDVLLAMALRACRADDIHARWLLEEVTGLTEPRLQAALLDFVARVDPSDWNSAQWGMASTLLALRLPTMSPTREPDAWEAFTDVIEHVIRQAPTAGGDEGGHVRVHHLLEEHRAVLADLLSQLRSARVVMWNNDPNVEVRLLDALGDGLVDVLVWSLDHPDRLRSPFRFSREDERTRHTLELLGLIGDARAADVLRRFADDRRLGTTAVEAVREIEARL